MDTLHLFNTLHVLKLKVVIVIDSKIITFAKNYKERTE